MDISKALCPDCGRSMQLTQAACSGCGVQIGGDFETSALGRLAEADQLFVVAFLRHHGSIRKMEGLFGISYPTVKNRLRAIVAKLDREFQAPSSNALILGALSQGEITVEEALGRLEST